VKTCGVNEDIESSVTGETDACSEGTTGFAGDNVGVLRRSEGSKGSNDDGVSSGVVGLEFTFGAIGSGFLTSGFREGSKLIIRILGIHCSFVSNPSSVAGRFLLRVGDVEEGGDDMLEARHVVSSGRRSEVRWATDLVRCDAD
jgi:hypothetical protein